MELYFSHSTTKTKLNHVTRIDTHDLTAKKTYYYLKDHADNLDINKPTNIPTTLNKLKTKVDHLDVGKLKTAPVDLKKLHDAVDNKDLRNIKFKTIKTRINASEKKS